MNTTKTKRTKKGTPVSVRFGGADAQMRRYLEARATAHGRSLSDQIKHYTRLGMIASDNPDMPLGLIEGVLEAREEFKAGLGQPYQFGVLKPEA